MRSSPPEVQQYYDTTWVLLWQHGQWLLYRCAKSFVSPSVKICPLFLVVSVPANPFPTEILQLIVPILDPRQYPYSTYMFSLFLYICCTCLVFGGQLYLLLLCVHHHPTSAQQVTTNPRRVHHNSISQDR